MCTGVQGTTHAQLKVLGAQPGSPVLNRLILVIYNFAHTEVKLEEVRF